MRNDPLARNIAEVIDDLYRQHAPPRDHERLIALIQHQIEHVQRLTAKPLNEEIRRLREEIERADETNTAPTVKNRRADFFGRRRAT
jgi:hypothetical protein